MTDANARDTTSTAPPSSLHRRAINRMVAASPAPVQRFVSRLRASPLGMRLARGAFWSLAGAVISRGLGLLSSILVARLLGKTGFGELGIIQSTVGMFGAIAGFGLGLTATKHVAEFRQKDPAKAGRILALATLVALASGSVMTVALLIMAPWLAANTLAAPQLAPLLRVGAGLLFFGALNGAQTGALAGFEAFRAIAKINLASGLLAFPLMVGGALLAGLQGAVWGLVASMAINWLLNRLAIIRVARKAGVPLSMAGCRKEWHVLWSFSLPSAISSAIWGPVTWATAMILVNQPGGYGEMGIYNAANQWRAAVLFLPGIIGNLILPVLSNLEGVDDKVRYRRVLNLTLLTNCGVAAVATLPIILLAKTIMSSYGAGFESGAWVLILLVASAGIAVATAVGQQALTSRGKMWTKLSFLIIWSAVLLISSVVLVKDHGATGLAVANLIAYSVQGVCLYAYFRIARIGSV